MTCYQENDVANLINLINVSIVVNAGSLGSLVPTFDLNHNFRYLVKSMLKC